MSASPPPGQPSTKSGSSAARSPLILKTWADETFGPARTCLYDALGFDLPLGEELKLDAIVHRPWSFAAVDGDRTIGVVGGYRFDLTVPGGRLPTVGTTLVSIQPTHRRRGVLTRGLQAQFQAARRDGAVLAALWASETPIYTRFGFGRAADRGEWRIEARRCRPVSPPSDGRVDLYAPEEALPAMKAVYDQHLGDRAGMLSRTEAWWQVRRIHDPPARRGGFGPFRVALHRTGSEVDGYVQFRRRSQWVDDLPRDEISVWELVGTDKARRALWAFILSIDLVEKVTSFSQPVDDIVPLVVEDPRRAALFAPDALWVRPLDVPRLLAARRYSVEGELRIRVRPTRLGIDGVDHGVFRLIGGEDHARCEPDEGPADIELDLGDLASLSFGGASAVRLASAGRLNGEASVLRRADLMFRTSLAPWCPERF